jgi:beta-lactamase class A
MVGWATVAAVLTTAGPPRADDVLRRDLAAILREARGRFGLERIAATLVDLESGRRASVGGKRRFYAASLVKVFFAVALHDAARAGRVTIDEAARRDLRAMLGPSSNEAANRILDLACGTEAGPALRGAALRSFVRRRGCVEDALARRGLRALRAAHKLSFSSPRDRQLYRFRPSNSVSAEETAQLFYLLHRGRAVDPTADAEIREMMRRPSGRGHPIHAPIANGIPEGGSVVSKAGWTRRWAHDAAIVEGPAKGVHFLLVVLTRQARPGPHLTWIARRVYRLLAAHSTRS